MNPLQTYQETARELLDKAIANDIAFNRPDLYTPDTETLEFDTALAALTTAARITMLEELQRLVDLSPCAAHEGKEHSCVTWLRDNIRERIKEYRG